MRRKVALLAILSLLTGVTVSASEADLPDFLQVLGMVRSAPSYPVGGAMVVAFNLSTFHSSHTRTDVAGSFRLPKLPTGVYRLVAVKQGFAPAVATLMPTHRDVKVDLRLHPQGKVSAADKNQIWEIRRSLPADVLREIDTIMADVPTEPALDDARFGGSMLSLTGYAPEQSVVSLERTAVALRGNLGGGWGVGFEGRMQSIDEPATHAALAVEPLAESSDVVLELRSSPAGTYRLATTKASWKYAAGFDQPVDVRSHSFAWRGQASNVELRYLAHENLFGGGASDRQVFEVAGDTRIYSSDRGNLGMTVRVAQQSTLNNSLIDSHQRLADFTTRGRVHALPGLALDYGLQTRVGPGGTEWIPQSGAEIKLGTNASIIVSGLYKLDERGQPVWETPGVVYLGDALSGSNRYRYAIAIAVGDPRSLRFSAEGSIAEIDAVTRILLDNRYDQFWEGFFLENGDVRRDLVLSIEKLVGNFAIGIRTTAGRAEGETNGERTVKDYLTTDLQSIFQPWGTSFDVAYRYVEQPPVDDPLLLAETERLNIRMGQSLHLPLDLKLLLGVDVARARSLESSDEDAIQKRLVGGVSFAF